MGSSAAYAGGIRPVAVTSPEPQRDEADVDLAAGGDDVAVDVGAGDLREDRLQPLRLVPAAAKIWLMPMYDGPVIPDPPLLHGRLRRREWSRPGQH